MHKLPDGCIFPGTPIHEFVREASNFPPEYPKSIQKKLSHLFPPCVLLELLLVDVVAIFHTDALYNLSLKYQLAGDLVRT